MTDLVVIVVMALATYACRSLGYLVMGYVPITPAVRRALDALPGAVVVSVVLPGALTAGPSGVVGICGGLTAMALTRRDIIALVAGCLLCAAARAAGL